ncbi:hypothetical protein Tco_0305457 [Tanacetum coccineum]
METVSDVITGGKLRVQFNKVLVRARVLNDFQLKKGKQHEGACNDEQNYDERNKAYGSGREVVVQDVDRNEDGIINTGQANNHKCYNLTGLGHIAPRMSRPSGLQRFRLLQGQDATKMQPGRVDHVHGQISHQKDLIYDEAGTSCESNTPSELYGMTTKNLLLFNDDVSSVQNDALMSFSMKCNDQGVQVD